MDIKEKVNRGGHLVDVLSARALGTHGLHEDFLIGDGHAFRQPEHKTNLLLALLEIVNC